MAKSLIAVTEGMKYQAWLFWQHAAGLLRPTSGVQEVLFEHGEVQSFDDVVVRYEPARKETFSKSFTTAHFQAKYRLNSAKAFGIGSFTDPEFINATSESILQKLGTAYKALGSSFSERRFWIVSPSAIDPADKRFQSLFRDNTADLCWEVLAQGKQRGQWFELRAQWRDAVGVDSDDELATVLKQLRIGHSVGGLNSRFADQVSLNLQLAGLRPLGAAAAADPYGQIPWILHGQGQTSYREVDIRALANEYSLWDTSNGSGDRPRRIGIRTRVEWGARMETETDAYLPLEGYFDGRFVRDAKQWPTVFRNVEAFVQSQVTDGRACHIDLGAVSTIAFVAGYANPHKNGLRLYPIQRSKLGAEAWDDVAPADGLSGLSAVHDERLQNGGEEIAVGISLSRAVWSDMEGFVRGRLPAVTRLVELQGPRGPGQAAVAGGAHASYLAEEAERILRELRRETSAKLIHLFISAPNGFSFFLGQQGERLGRIRMYEFDFANALDGSYMTSVTVPDDAKTT